MRRLIAVLTVTLAVALNVSADEYQESKEMFKNKCSECHQMISIPAEDIIKNYEGGNKIYNLKAPVVSMLAWAIMVGPKKVGSPDLPEMRPMEIEAFLVDYLYGPDIQNSICDPRIASFHGAKESMKGKVSEEEIAATVPYLMGYRDRKPEER